MAPHPSPGRSSTSSNMAWLTLKLEARGSGGAATRRLNVPSSQWTKPLGGLAFTTLRRLAASSPARASARSFSLTCSGAWATTLPAESKPARPARPAIWWNSRADSTRLVVPSYFDNAVKRTVRMGTFIPTPSVSVPQTTFSSPSWHSLSTSRR